VISCRHVIVDDDAKHGDPVGTNSSLILTSLTRHCCVSNNKQWRLATKIKFSLRQERFTKRNSLSKSLQTKTEKLVSVICEEVAEEE